MIKRKRTPIRTCPSQLLTVKTIVKLLGPEDTTPYRENHHFGRAESAGKGTGIRNISDGVSGQESRL